MSGVLRGAVTGLLLDGAELDTLAALVAIVERVRHRQGLPGTAAMIRLKTLTAEAITAQRTANSHPEPPGTYRLVTTREYAFRVGISQRTARRRATRLGTKTGGRWQIPLLPEED